MSDLTAYRAQVADLGKAAVAHETAKEWEAAYNCYHSALKVFVHMIKCKFSILFLTLNFSS